MWTPSAAPNWDCVDDATSDGDTTYVAANTPGFIDTYTMDDLSTASGPVQGVQYLLDARKDQAGSRTVEPVVRIGGVDYLATTAALGDSYAFVREVAETSPASETTWTIDEINAMEYGACVDRRSFLVSAVVA
jgi:hypothetical protein